MNRPMVTGRFGAAVICIMRLVASTLREMAKAKEKLPEPLSLQKFSGKFMVRIPPAQHRKLALDAAEQGV